MTETNKLPTPQKASHLPASVASMKWGNSGADSEDILVSKIILIQSGNPLIMAKKAKLGDIVESIDGKILATEGQKLEFIPLVTYKNWRRYKMEGTKQVYLETVPWSPGNSHWEKEENRDDGKYKNVKCLNFFVLVSGYELPLVLTFRGGSTYAGKKVSTHFSLSDMKNLPPFVSAFDLSTQPATFDSFNFYAYDVVKKRATTPEEIEVAATWWKKLSSAKANVQVAETSEGEEVQF